jgi:hypothetical protein
MTRFLTSKQFGNFNVKGDKIRVFRKPLNASAAIAQKKSMKRKPTKRIKGLQRP